MVNHPSRRIIFKLQITLAFKILNFSYCEKATKVWKNSPFVLRRKVISKHGGIFFLILLPSHNKWTLKSVNFKVLFIIWKQSCEMVVYHLKNISHHVLKLLDFQNKVRDFFKFLWPSQNTWILVLWILEQ